MANICQGLPSKHKTFVEHLYRRRPSVGHCINGVQMVCVCWVEMKSNTALHLHRDKVTVSKNENVSRSERFIVYRHDRMPWVSGCAIISSECIVFPNLITFAIIYVLDYSYRFRIIVIYLITWLLNMCGDLVWRVTLFCVARHSYSQHDLSLVISLAPPPPSWTLSLS